MGLTWLWIVIGIAAAVIVIIVIWYISAYNNFIKMKNQIEEANATIDVYLKKRFDLIPNLVETVKGYAKHEKSTFEEITNARAGVMNAKTPEQKAESENRLGRSLGNLFAVAEAYPDLKANTNFLELQNRLNSIENDIANARKYYNGTVRNFNTKLDTFPTNIIARKYQFTKQPLYEVANASERENVKVDFS